MGRKAVSFLFYGISVVLTGLLLVAAVLCRYASSVSPGEGGFWATLALLMPVVLLANVVALVWWAVRRKWIVLLMPLVALVLNLGYISAMVQLPDFKDSGDPHDIMPATARAIAGMVNREQVDVLCLQEFMDSREFPADSIGKVFARRMPYFLHEGGAALASRYPVLDHKYVRFADTSNDYLRADLLVGGDTVRLFAVHLQTSGIAQLRHRFRKDYDRDAPVEQILGELEHNSSIRAGQVGEIRAEMDASPYPVILAGDFNDTPSSYTYRTMKGDMTDGFRDSGSGYGGTFRYLGGVLRIDYIFYDDAFEGIRYYMPPEDVSDHKAVVAELRFR